MLREVVVLFSVFLACGVNGHTYHLGDCPNIDPEPNFDMDKFLGIWYAVQKTSTASTCITYNYTKTDEPYQYELEQVSQHFVLGLTPLEHTYRYTGRLVAPDPAIPAKMQATFPLNFVGNAAYTVFMTDYTNYAAIFSCQKVAFGHRRSATILSRSKTLNKIYVDKIRTRLSSYNIDPFDLSIITQTNCPKQQQDGVNIGIDSDTFSAHSIAGVVRKAGEKIGDGIEYVAGGAKKIYHKVTDSSKEETTEKSRKYSQEPQAEWLP